MRFQSVAHRERIKELVLDGKITPEYYAEMEKATGKRVLPTRIGKRNATPRRTNKA